jgi:hypothetical protein
MHFAALRRLSRDLGITAMQLPISGSTKLMSEAAL